MAIHQILDALEAAHFKNCIHRDIKPENILFDSSRRKFVVSDFGIAHFEEEDLLTPVETLHADRLANFQYAAPEQRQKGSIVDLRADIYALGLMINESFTGSVPHGAGFKKIGSILTTHTYLDEVVEKMIQQSPQNRHQSILEVKEDLYKKGKLALSIQKVDEIQKAVVLEEDVSGHPMVANPVKIVGVDHDGRSLICNLNHSVASQWQELFSSGGFAFSSIHHPQMVRFHGNALSIQTPIEMAPQAKNLIDQWIAGANGKFRDHLIAEQRRKAEARRRELAAEAEHERKRQEFLSKITF